ncbi:pilus assembly protein TadG-related protein [Algiphilus sp.]|uniref:pilus assembly protein TadG-related protein n=1 Tax=Algiphilus sp. TaxID=1872431 RepID=UPI003B521D85
MHRHRQRGAAAVFAAIALTALLAAMALTVDIGRLYFAQRDLQNAANLAALDASRKASGCYGPIQDSPLATANTVAIDSLIRNGFDAGNLTTVRVGGINRTPDALRFFDPDADNRSFAVQVGLQRPAPPRLLPLFVESSPQTDTDAAQQAPDERRLFADASASVRNDVALSLGSYGARINPQAPGTLLQALPGNLSITALDYAALVDAEINLLDVLEPGSLSEITEVLAEETTLPAFLDGISDALLAANELVAASVTSALAAAAQGLNQTLIPAELVNLEGQIAPAINGVTVSAGALVEAAIQSVLIDGFFEALIQLGGGREVAVRLREAAQVVEGPPGFREDGEELTEARTAQARVSTQVPLTGLLPTGTSIELFAEAASARAAVTGVRCPSAGNPLREARIRTRTSVTSIGLEPITVTLSLAQLQASLEDSAAPLAGVLQQLTGLSCGLLGLLSPQQNALCDLLQDNPVIEIRIALAAPVTLPGADEEFWVQEPFPKSFSVAAPMTATLSQLLDQAIEIELSVAGTPPVGLAGTVLNSVLAAARPVLQSTLVTALVDTVDEVLTPALEGLGVSLAGADVTVTEMTVQRPKIFSAAR